MSDVSIVLHLKEVRNCKERTRISFPGVGDEGPGGSFVKETSPLVLLLCKVRITSLKSELYAPKWNWRSTALVVRIRLGFASGSELIYCVIRGKSLPVSGPKCPQSRMWTRSEAANWQAAS